jgi:putative transposase
VLRRAGSEFEALKHLADVIEGVPFKDGYRTDDNTDLTQMQDAA